jgi:hypothetical protein
MRKRRVEMGGLLCTLSVRTTARADFTTTFESHLLTCVYSVTWGSASTTHILSTAHSVANWTVYMDPCQATKSAPTHLRPDAKSSGVVVLSSARCRIEDVGGGRPCDDSWTNECTAAQCNISDATSQKRSLLCKPCGMLVPGTCALPSDVGSVSCGGE